MILEDKVVIDVIVGRFNFFKLFENLDLEEKWEFCFGGFWIKCFFKWGVLDLKLVVMVVDVFFGDDVIEVRVGWMLIGLMVLFFDGGRKFYVVYIIVWRGVLVEIIKFVLWVRDNGWYKIM